MLDQRHTVVDQWFCYRWLNKPLNGKIHDRKLFFLFALVKLWSQIFASTPHNYFEC